MVVTDGREKKQRGGFMTNVMDFPDPNDPPASLRGSVIEHAEIELTSAKDQRFGGGRQTSQCPLSAKRRHLRRVGWVAALGPIPVRQLSRTALRKQPFRSAVVVSGSGHSGHLSVVGCSGENC